MTFLQGWAGYTACCLLAASPLMGLRGTLLGLALVGLGWSLVNVRRGRA